MGSIASMVGQAGQTVLTSYGMKEQGKEARRGAEQRNVAAQFRAAQMEEKAGEAIAIAQRHGIEERRQAGFVASRALAVAAASGGGASNTTVVNLIAKIKGEGAYRAAARMYAGESQARALRLQASATRYEGAQGVMSAAREQEVGNNMAFANLLIGAGSLQGKYGGGTSGGTSGGMYGESGGGGEEAYMDAGSEGMGGFA